MRMNLTFRVRFATQTGQSLWLAGGKPLSGEMPLQFLDLELWQIKIPLAAGAEKTPLNYSYILRDTGGAQTADWGRDRVLVPASFDCNELLIIDSWNAPGFFENAFYTEPFKKVLLAEYFTEVKTIAPKNPTHTFHVKSPLLAKGQTVCLLGEGATLGRWNTQSPILLGRRPDEDYFSVQLDLRSQTFPLPYKYGVFDVAKITFVRYEDCANRILKWMAGLSMMVRIAIVKRQQHFGYHRSPNGMSYSRFPIAVNCETSTLPSDDFTPPRISSR